LSDSALFDVLILVVATVAIGLLSYYDLPKRPHKLGAQETRASRALTDAYGYAVIVGCAIVGTHIGDDNHAPHVGMLLGVLAGALLAILTRGAVARLLAGRTRAR